jgi:hypothetical protein
VGFAGKVWQLPEEAIGTRESGTTKFKSRAPAHAYAVSESFQAALARVDLGKYIDQIQRELKIAVTDIGPGKTPGEVEAIQVRLQELIRRQSMELAREIGFLGNQAMVFMLSNSIISTAWVAFTLRRETSDLTKSPEDRLAVIEMLDSLANAMADLVQEGSNYADRYGGPGAEGPATEGPSQKAKP